MFIRAIPNGDSSIDIGDPVSVLDYLFGTSENTCDDAVDGNDSGGMDVANAVYSLSFLFAHGPPPPAPFPVPGKDLTPDTLRCNYYGAHPAP